jgi:hypothetical protein
MAEKGVIWPEAEWQFSGDRKRKRSSTGEVNRWCDASRSLKIVAVNVAVGESLFV